MKILLATKTFNPITHGPAKFAHFMLQINQYYPEHEIRILTEGIDHEIPNLIYKITTNYPRPFGSLWPIFDNFKYYKKIEQIKVNYDFDILLFNNAIQSTWSRIKLPITIYVFGMLNDYDYLSENFSTLRYDRRWIINFHRKFLEGLAVRNIDQTITNSYYLKEQVCLNYKASERKVSHLYKSIDITKISYQPKGKISLQDRIKIIFVKSDYHIGGLKILIEALTILSDLNFRLTIIGPKEIHKKNIFAFLKEAINIEINYLGPQSQETVFTAFTTHHLFCVPSHKEALGVANIEALASGIPVVSTRVGGIPEVLDQGKNGWLCEANNVKSLADTIKTCLKDEAARNEKSHHGRAFVTANFGHEQMLDKLIKILAQG